MKDFAAAAMLRLVALGLRREGLVGGPLPGASAALVPLQDKRQQLAQLMQAHGPDLLLRLGLAVQDAADEPTLRALTQARSAPDLIERWQRLERYVHSRHRVLLLADEAGGCTLRHVSLHAGEAPHAAEDLLVLGLLVGLLRRLGTPALRARLAGEADWRYQQDGWRTAPVPAATHTWELAWRASAEAAAPGSEPDLAATVAAARRQLAADVAAPWTLPRLAQALQLRPRTLQRRLTDAGSSFSQLWTEVRLAQSARLLLDTREPAAQIGYLCGFADQAHFTRSFKRSTAMTPAVYRAQFAGAALAQ